MEKAIQEALDWVDNNQLADKEEFEHQLKSLQDICQPIITKVYQSAGGAEGGAGGMPDMGGAAGGEAGGASGPGPKIEEVD